MEEREFDNLEDAYKCCNENPGSKLRWVAAIGKWVVTVAAATGLVYAFINFIIF
jgi:hypothetical protein